MLLLLLLLSLPLSLLLSWLLLVVVVLLLLIPRVSPNNPNLIPKRSNNDPQNRTCYALHARGESNRVPPSIRTCLCTCRAMALEDTFRRLPTPARAPPWCSPYAPCYGARVQRGLFGPCYLTVRDRCDGCGQPTCPTHAHKIWDQEPCMAWQLGFNTSLAWL